MYVPENTRKPFGFLFSGVQREDIGLKWAKIINWNKKNCFALYCFHPLETIQADENNIKQSNF